MSRRWTTPQASIVKALCHRAIANTEIARRSKSGVYQHEYDADLQLFGKVLKEVQDALRRGTGVAGMV